MTDHQVPVLGFAAYSGTGKTTLLSNLIPILRENAFNVGLIKHSHHNFEIDRPGKDSYRLRKAGASPVMLVSKKRRAIITEFIDNKKEPDLFEQLDYFDHHNLDLILVEGFKKARIPKIELHRPAMGKPLLFPKDKSVIAIATDEKLLEAAPIPVFDLNTAAPIARFILDTFLKQ